MDAASSDLWLKRVASVLKGEDFSKLVSRTDDEITIEPLYQRIDGVRSGRSEAAPWAILQRVDHPDPMKANAQALADLANGATGLAIVTSDAPSARGFGISASTLRTVLEGVKLHAISTRLEGSVAEDFAALIESQPIDPERLEVSFGLTDSKQALSLYKRGFRGALMEADGRHWHEQGATEAQELGAVLAAALGQLRALEQLNDQDLVRSVGVTLAAEQDMFVTMAKFRAMRLLWRQVLTASGLPDHELKLHGETSWRMMATLDPHTNILRAVAAVFGSGLGGASSFCVLPFSVTQGLPNAFARRVARNVQNVLLAESNLWRVTDPASGAGYVEALTASLCEKAWDVFQNCEKGNWPKPDPSLATNRPVIGTSAYRLATEYPAEVEALA